MKNILVKILKLYKSRFLFFSFCVALTNLLMLLVPYYNEKFIDSLILLKNIDDVKKYAGLVIIFSVINTVSEVLSGYIKVILVEKLKFNIKFGLINKLRSVSYLKFKEFNPSYLYQRIEQDSATTVGFVVENVVPVFIYGIKLIGVFYILLTINVYIAGLVVILIPIYLFIYSTFKEPLRAKNLKVREQQNMHYKDMSEQLELMYSIKLNAEYDKENGNLNTSFSHFMYSYKNYIKTLMVFNFSQGGVSFLFQIITLILGGYYVVMKKMSVGELAVISTYYGMLESIVKYYYSLGKDYQNFLVADRRNKELLAMTSEEEGSVAFDEIHTLDTKITYSYKDRVEVLSNICFNMSKGELLVITGENGSGKSTLIQLLNGILREETACPIYNGENITCIDTTYLRRNAISNVPQNIDIRECTVSDYLELNISDIENEITRIKEFFHYDDSREDKHLIDFIRGNVEEKVSNLSGGDKQLLCIIKAFYKNKSMLILDEPTAHLDYIRVEWFKKYINRIKKNKLIIIITHDDRLEFSGEKKLYLGK